MNTALPLTIEPADAAATSVDALLERIEEERDALDHGLVARGAILFRGFDVIGAGEFERVVTALAGAGLRNYAGGASPRRALADAAGPIYNSTDYPPALELPLHNELSYSSNYPSRITFCCLIAPTCGGATTLGDSRRILSAIPPAIRAAFETRGIEYIRLLGPEQGSGYSWQDAFRCDDRAAAERVCAAAGAEHEWLAGDVLRVVQRRPATVRHSVTGEEVWFNQAVGFHPSALDPASYAELMRLCGDESRFRLNVRYGDGSPIPAATIAEVAAVLRREAAPHVWRAGDVLLLDNLLTAHGRTPFEGARKIAVAMS